MPAQPEQHPVRGAEPPADLVEVGLGGDEPRRRVPQAAGVDGHGSAAPDLEPRVGSRPGLHQSAQPVAEVAPATAVGPGVAAEPEVAAGLRGRAAAAHRAPAGAKAAA